ncbi:MAG: Fe-S protein [Pseudomonadales bacterium]|nr:Fe-S protein [Pseudomonadales bacterium]
MLSRLHRDAGHARGVELGPYPLEALGQGAEFAIRERVAPRQTPHAPDDSTLAQTASWYANLFLDCAQQESAPESEGSTDPVIRAKEVKGAAYYLDAAHVGICRIPDFATDDAHFVGRYATVILVAYGRDIGTQNLAHEWIDGASHAIAQMRGHEIGVSVMGHIRALGFEASIHTEGSNTVSLESLASLAGIVQIKHGEIESPFVGKQFSLVAISTNYQMDCDKPLDPSTTVPQLKYWLGINGAVSGRERNRRAKRPPHYSRYPMEQVTRVDVPTTKIYADEVPRVPKRAEFFMRARMGDLGDKAQREVQRFAFKHPLTNGMMYPLRAMVPHQDGDTEQDTESNLTDPAVNTEAIKALSYHLGADLTGICEIPRYAWYSHGPTGEPYEMKHRYAVVMLIDQGYDTMEGASGDDWISGCQSMRGYIRGAEIAGVMADFLRKLGHDSRPQTNADSQVLQIPLVLQAGLGELSRIGELVLNPYVGPRFKSVVLTTNLPLVPDQPIDFGLQEFCGNCLKCARECPVNAIPFGDKVMFNGYEIWKPDVERCTRYRVTNPKGSACGRCMKTCPLNKVVSSDGAFIHRIGTWLGVNARPLKRLLVPIAVRWDDKLGYGTRNPIKRWWQDLEIVDGIARKPKATNERDLDVNADTSGAKSPVGYYHAADNPPPNTKVPVVANHKEAIARAAYVETPAQAAQRHTVGTTPPEHYTPTPSIPVTDITDE